MLTGTSYNQVSLRQHDGHEIVSQPIKVEVYAQPRIHPNDIFMVPGAAYMVCIGKFSCLFFASFNFHF